MKTASSAEVPPTLRKAGDSSLTMLMTLGLLTSNPSHFDSLNSLGAIPTLANLSSTTWTYFVASIEIAILSKGNGKELNQAL